LPVTLYKDC